jgi:2-polyprenyl-3-methyl-5-hydroxy-6-metoxy-1,4-benzoquinol methylase
MTEGWRVQRFWHVHKFALISALIPDDPEITIMDVGCGPGSFFYQHKKRGKKIGVDFAESQISYAKKVMPDVNWICANVENASLPKADYVVFSEVLEHLPPNTEILKKINGVMKKGGKLIMTTPNYSSLWPVIEKVWDWVSPVKYEEQHINPQTPKTLKKEIESSGFKLIGLKTMFLFTPFVAFISDKLALRLSRIEQKMIGKMGYVMIAVCEKR